MKKILYEEGMCRHLQYKGLWPITYKSDDGSMYKKDCMACIEAEKSLKKES